MATWEDRAKRAYAREAAKDAEISRLKVNYRESVKGGDWARAEATEAKGALVVANVKIARLKDRLRDVVSGDLVIVTNEWVCPQCGFTVLITPVCGESGATSGTPLLCIECHPRKVWMERKQTRTEADKEN